MRASLRARLHSAAAILCARDAGVGAVPVRPPTKSTLHDPSGFVGPHHRGCPPVKTRRPADCVATRTTGKCQKNRCFSRSSTPSRAPEGPQSIGNRSASTRPRSGTRTRSPSPRSSISPGRAFTACRRRSDKARELSSAATVLGVEARPTHPLPRARVPLRQPPAPGAPGGENHLPGSPRGAAPS